MSDVFVSHSSADKLVAHAVCHHLEARGIRCWVAPRDISHGQEWADAVVDAVSACRIMVLIFSGSANDSAIVRREVLLAVNREKAILPFRIEAVLPARAMELFISGSHWLDAITPPIERHIASLADSVGSLLSGPTEVDRIHNPVREIESIAERWVAAGCPYAELEGIDRRLRLLVQESPSEVPVKSEAGRLMLMMLALHFGRNWLAWTDANRQNGLAPRHLLAQLEIAYFRPRLRALYALQQWPRKTVEDAVSDLAGGLPEDVAGLLERYVYTGTVADYLERVRHEADADIAGKAAVVMREVALQLGIGGNPSLPNL
jgi:hypothetical protein